VAEGIRASGVPRYSKLWATWHSRVEEALDESLANFGTDYLDLYLVHPPVPMIPTLPCGIRDVDHSWDLKETDSSGYRER